MIRERKKGMRRKRRKGMSRRRKKEMSRGQRKLMNIRESGRVVWVEGKREGDEKDRSIFSSQVKLLGGGGTEAAPSIFVPDRKEFLLFVFRTPAPKYVN